MSSSATDSLTEVTDPRVAAVPMLSLRDSPILTFSTLSSSTEPTAWSKSWRSTESLVLGGGSVPGLPTSDPTMRSPLVSAGSR